MMNVNIICVGKIKESFYKDAINEYAKRLSRFCKFNIVEVAEELVDSSLKNLDVVKKKEGERILSKAQDSYKIVLDIKGENISSEMHAKKIQTLAVNGISEISYIIGGSYGLSQDVLNAANFKISFGKQTYPHQLMRVILSEQIYRAYTIIEGSNYHK